MITFRIRIHAAALACVLAFNAGPLFAQVKATYLYKLSDFSGPLRYDLMRVRVDDERDEIYVIYQNLVRVFNPSGMEIFTFGDDVDLGQVLDAAIDAKGDIIVLSYKDSRSIVTRCNFRGLPVAPIEIKDLPPGMVFGANRMILRNDLFYFVSLGSSSVTITDAKGEFRQHVDFLPLLDVDEKQKQGAEMIGVAVDQEGSIFFTIPAVFKVCKYTADGKLASFGRPGSAAGRFGVLGGLVVDSQGNVLVADKLKCVVMAFDKDFKFLAEFGYRGPKPQNLVVPDDIAIDRRDRIYVAQSRRRGVSVFALEH